MTYKVRTFGKYKLSRAEYEQYGNDIPFETRGEAEKYVRNKWGKIEGDTSYSYEIIEENWEHIERNSSKLENNKKAC